jgi:hypothetical protein
MSQPERMKKPTASAMKTMSMRSLSLSVSPYSVCYKNGVKIDPWIVKDGSRFAGRTTQAPAQVPAALPAHEAGVVE